MSAIPYNSTISNEGKYAVCQTCMNPKNGDGNKFTTFDVERRQELFSINPATGWADEYRFAEDRAQFLVVHKNIGQFRYDKSGKFLDYAAYDSARLNCDQYHIVLMVIEEKLKNADLTIEQLEFILYNIKRAKSLGADKDKSWNGVALKLQGFVLERMGKPAEALAVFEAAMNVNEKIGVRRKIAALKKQLQK